MGEHADALDALTKKMRDAEVPELAQRCFADHFQRLFHDGSASGLIGESSIDPVSELPRVAKDPASERVGAEAMPRAVMVKLNGGLGTSMGMNRAKSLLRVRGEDTFLDLLARQAHHCGVPLLLMNSAQTRDDSLARLALHPRVRDDLPRDFLQHQVPKVLQDGLGPVSYPAAPQLEWCPPGHGDIYPALVTSGVLETLLKAGYRYLFLSNSDNLGATLSADLLGHFISQDVPFLMEVTDRLPDDRKGGHLARDKSGNLLLRESAQCPEEDRGEFENVNKHVFFNTNNIWIHLPKLAKILTEKDGILGLPPICNRKTVNPRDPASVPVFQLESAMGSALSVLPGAAAVHVTRDRFGPVKTTNDLLLVGSDAFALNEQDRLVPSAPGKPLARIALDPEFYRLFDQFQERFPAGSPSLQDATRFEVTGNVRFEGGVVCRGEVQVIGGKDLRTVSEGRVLEGRVELS